MNRPIHFRGGNSYLSNFYVCRIHVWNRELNTVESAYQWCKCMHHGDMQTAEKIISTRPGLQAKHLTRAYERRSIYA